MTKARYNHESLERALDIAQGRGAIADWSGPEYGRPAWLVYEKGRLDPFEFTAPQVYGFVVACAMEVRRQAREADTAR